MDAAAARPEQVAHIANLARIDLSPEEIATLTAEIHSTVVPVQPPG